MLNSLGSDIETKKYYAHKIVITTKNFYCTDFILFDGATGTEYQKYGLPIGAAPEIFILEKLEIVKQIHEEYISAGAQVIETNTFGDNRIRLESGSLHNKAA